MIFKNILMCKPKYFDVIHYKLNSHMLMNININKDKSMLQWLSLKKNLDMCDVNINLQQLTSST